MSDIKTEILFGASVAESKENIDFSKGDLLEWKEDKMARELGMKICQEKGWFRHEEDEIVISNIRLYVFTPEELRKYVKAVNRI